MKDFIIKVSEEMVHTYKIKADNKQHAERLALQMCDNEYINNMINKTYGRTEIIETKEVL